jgi:hypothetical protein
VVRRRRWTGRAFAVGDPPGDACAQMVAGVGHQGARPGELAVALRNRVGQVSRQYVASTCTTAIDGCRPFRPVRPGGTDPYGGPRIGSSRFGGMEGA